MSYEDDDGWDDPDEGDGPLTPVASYLTVHEAELARSKLVSEGFRAFVWDAGIVAADPLLAVAVRGVKVVVARRFVPRARAVLEATRFTFATGDRPVFRVRAPPRSRAIVASAALGLALGGGLALAFDAPALVLVALPAAAAIDAIGRARATDTCSGCAAPLPDEDVAACPRCALLVRGTIAHADERLAAEEACDDADGRSASEGDVEGIAAAAAEAAPESKPGGGSGPTSS